jgi:ADP-ribosyl-[dinitrogen reductase] hydrolase
MTARELGRSPKPPRRTVPYDHDARPVPRLPARRRHRRRTRRGHRVPVPAEIQRRHGPAGITGYVPAYGRTGAITDDTQMTLFTAEGLLRGQRHPSGQHQAPGAIWRAYQRWLLTQSETSSAADLASGWLISQDFLHHERAPGLTCLNALHARYPGTVSQPVNDSKGCGGVMRVAPIGLACDDPFTLGCQAAALTHGHPSGYLAAGAFALMISELVRGQDCATPSSARSAGSSRRMAADR